MALFILLLIIFQVVSASENHQNDGILQHLNSGMKFAKDFLGTESVALKVADFVVRAFQTAHSPINNKRSPNPDFETETAESDSERRKNYHLNKNPSPMSPWKHLVKLLGLQTNQISAVAVNALIFVAQMITTFLASPKGINKTHRHDDPINWILNKNSQKLQKLIATARNESLPDLVSEIIEEQESQEETSCISLLVCKIVPFVTKMQKVVFHEEEREFDSNIREAYSLLRYLPTQEEIDDRSDICERKFKDCELNE